MKDPGITAEEGRHVQSSQFIAWGLTASSPSTGSPSSSTNAALHGNQFMVIFATTAVLILVLGCILAHGRNKLAMTRTERRSLWPFGKPSNGSDPSPGDKGGSGSNDGESGNDASFVRGWLAISLVGGLLLLSAASLGLADSGIRNTLFGAVIANAGAAAAFYFASKSSEQARRDLLTASSKTLSMPNLVGQKLSEVQKTLAALPLSLELVNPTPAVTEVVTSHVPASGAVVPEGTSVNVTFSAQDPESVGLTYA